MNINDYYQQQFIMEQESIRDMALIMQFKDEQRMELNSDARHDADEEKEAYEC